MAAGWEYSHPSRHGESILEILYLQMTMKEIQKKDATLQKLLPPRTPQQGVRYVPSLYAVQVKHHDTDYLFNLLTRQCVEGVMPESAAAGEGFDELIADRFLVPEGTDECAAYEGFFTMMKTFTRRMGYTVYTVLPTYACNARCTYCYEENMKPVSMSDDTVEQTIRFICDTRGEGTVGLSWFGGEPLLRPDVIDRICEGLRGQEVEFSSTMISNGSLITSDIVRKMRDSWNLKQIQISMDGAEQDYITRKCYYEYKDYYWSVMKRINEITEAGIQVVIRCNVDSDNWYRVGSMLDDLKAYVRDTERIAVYFCLLNHVRQGDNDLDLWKKVFEAQSLLKKAGFRTGNGFGTGNVFRVYHCMADKGGVVICPDGSLYPCEHCPPEARFGDIWNNVTDEEARKAFCRTDHIREKCRTCPYLPDCTPFMACPVQDTHCREVMALNAADYVKRLVDDQEMPGQILL